MKNILTVENLHLFTGTTLILSGLLSYYQEGIGMMLSWAIFGAMYISMSDIGERKMSVIEKKSMHHRIKIFAACLGAGLSVWLLTTFFSLSS